MGWDECAYMEVALRDSALVNVGALGLVVRIGVQCLVGNDMVFQESLEILLAILAEEEAVDPWAKLLEGEVRGREEGSANMVGGVVDGFEEAGLGQAELESTELPGKELDDLGGFWRWDEEAVNSVDNTVGAELELSVIYFYLKGAVDVQY